MKEKFLFLFTMWIGKVLKIKKTPKNILIIKLDEIGDVYTALPAIGSVIAANQNIKIDVLCKPYCTDIFKHVVGIETIFANEKDWKKTYDLVIDLRGSWAVFFKLLIYTPKFYANRGAVRWKNKGNQQHEIDTNFDIIKPLNYAISPIIFKNLPFTKIDNWLKQVNLKPYNFVVVHATARKELRKWPTSKFIDIINYLWETYKLKTILIGTIDEFKQGDLILKACLDSCIHTFGVFNLVELQVLMQRALLFIGNESGPLQIADFVNLPSISLFGPGVPTVFYPKTKNSKIMHTVLNCNPCNQVDCVQQIPCIDRIETLEVKNTIDLVLNSLLIERKFETYE